MEIRKHIMSIFCFVCAFVIFAVHITCYNAKRDDPLPPADSIQLIDYHWRTPNGDFKSVIISSPDIINNIIKITTECLKDKADGMTYEISAAEMHILHIYRRDTDASFRISILADHYFEYRGYKYNVSKLVKYLSMFRSQD